jgi:hypothetical protein
MLSRIYATAMFEANHSRPRAHPYPHLVRHLWVPRHFDEEAKSSVADVISCFPYIRRLALQYIINIAGFHRKQHYNNITHLYIAHWRIRGTNSTENDIAWLARSSTNQTFLAHVTHLHIGLETDLLGEHGAHSGTDFTRFFPMLTHLALPGSVLAYDNRDFWVRSIRFPAAQATLASYFTPKMEILVVTVEKEEWLAAFGGLRSFAKTKFRELLRDLLTMDSRMYAAMWPRDAERLKHGWLNEVRDGHSVWIAAIRARRKHLNLNKLKSSG